MRARKWLPFYPAHAMRARNDPRFTPRTSCAPKMTLVLFQHIMRNKNLPRFTPARHAQQKLASFYSSTPCATKTCPVLRQHAMRARNDPRFTPARHARQKLAPFCSSTSCAPRNGPHFPPDMPSQTRNAPLFVLAQENEDHPWSLLFVLPHHHTISQDISHATLRTRSVPVAAEAKAMAILTDPSDLPRRIAHH